MYITLFTDGEKIYDIIAPKIIEKTINSIKVMRLLHELKHDVEEMSLKYKDNEIILLSSEFNNLQNRYFDIDKIFLEKLCYKKPMLENREKYIAKMIAKMNFDYSERKILLSYFH